MARINTNVAPYYETTESEASKNYYKLLAVPGRVAQAREITVLQGLLQNAIKSIGDAVMSNGDIVEGCQILVASDKKSVTVTEGRIYMEGIVIPISNTTVDITGSGTEIIGVKIEEEIVTDNTDETLRDPAQGYDNYGQSGCDRLKRTLKVVVNEEDASPLAHLEDGDITVENYAPSYDVLTQTLARRTYDESGSYIVEGLKVRVEDIEGDPSNYYVVVETGKAYVLGYELKIPTARRIKVPKSTTTSAVIANNYVYKTGTNSYSLDSDPYVQSINYVNGLVEVTEQQVLQTNTDKLPLTNTDVSEIVSIVQGSVTYTKGDSPSKGDYYLMRDGTRFYVKWNGRNAPHQGSNYTVKYKYNKNFINGTDYSLNVTPNGSFLVFSSDGEKPLNNTNISISYNQYLARRDIVYIDQYGDITVEKGMSDEYGFEVTPLTPVNTLLIALIKNPPNGSPSSTIDSLRIEVSNIGLTRFTMNDIQNILDRVKKTEYNQAILSLNSDARSFSTINSKKGILTDPLVDFSRIDYYFNLDSEGEKLNSLLPVYDMAIDLEAGIAYLPLNVYNYNIEASTITNAKKYNRLITLPTNGEKVALSQLNATKSFQVNPYSVFPKLPEVSVSPAVDSWVENNYVTVPVSLTNKKLINTTTSILYDTARVVRSGRFDSYTVNETISQSSKTVQTGTRTSTSKSKYSLIESEAISYMRQLEITVEGTNFPDNLDNIKCSFDGITVNLTPLGDTVSGTISGTVKANGNGYLKAKFIIPKKIRTGTREVRLWSDTIIDGYKSEGYTLFQSSGVSNTFQRTITTITTVLLEKQITKSVLSTTYVDPVGQTFVLDRETIIKGIELYFENKPTSREEVVVEIRNVVNGTIGSTVYASKSLKSSEVSVSNNSRTATRFNFSDPVVLEGNTEYAFVVRSLSDRYRLWVSELGGTDVYTKEVVLKNSYMTGVMMSSSNNSTWTAHQTTDIKFQLIEDVYLPSGSITFNKITTNSITRLDLMAESVILNGTNLKWYYSINGGTTFYSITPEALRDLGEATNEVIFKVDFSRSSSNNITPLLAYDSLSLIGSSYKTSGDYVGVTVTGIDSYKNVTVILDTLYPTTATTTLTFKASSDNGATTINLTKDPDSTRQLNDGWQEEVYKGSFSNNVTACKIFIHATSTSSAVTPKFSAIKIIMD